LACRKTRPFSANAVPPQPVAMPCPICGGSWHDLRAHMAKHKPERCEHCETLSNGQMCLDYDLILHPVAALQGRYFYHELGCGKYSPSE